MRRAWLASAVIVLTCLLPTTGHSTTFILMDEQQLLQTSDGVIVATVTAIESGQQAPDAPIYTYIHVQPERVLKGHIGRTPLVLREPGGSVGEHREWIFGAPEFSVGERALLFLMRNADGTFQTNNFAMGKYTVAINESGQMTAVRDLGPGTAALLPASGGIVEAPQQTHRYLPLLKRLRAIARMQESPQMPLIVAAPDLRNIPTEFHDAYTFINNPPVRWFEPDSGAPVDYFIDSAGDSTLGFATSRMSFDDALAAWTNVPTASLILEDGGTTPAVPLSDCTTTRVVFNDPFNEIPDPSQCSGTLAMGGYCSNGETKMVSGTTFVRIVVGRITVNNGWGGCSFWNECNVAEVLTHEIGHSIGLGHTTAAPRTCVGGANGGAACGSNADCNSGNCQSTSTMAAVAHFDGRCGGLKQDDMDGATFMYPLPGTPLPTATPTASPTITGTPTITLTPTQSQTPANTPTASVTNTATTTATRTPTRTSTSTVTSTSTFSQTATRTPSATLTATLTNTPTRTPTNTSTVTSTPTTTATRTPSVTLTATLTLTATRTPTPTLTRTVTHTPTFTPSATQSATTTATRTSTATRTTTETITQTPTLTATVTDTRTATQSPTMTQPLRVGGHLRYAGSGFPVSAATVQLTGPAPATTLSDSTGQFAFTNLGTATWQVRPRKMGDANNAISALDAVYVLQAAVQLRDLTPEQMLACDVFNNGVISALDAVLILQYKVGLVTSFPVAQACGSDWAFVPAPAPVPNQQLTAPLIVPGPCQPGNISWTPLTTPADDQDFNAVLFGDCSGNWLPPGVALTVAERPARVHLGRPHYQRRSRTVYVPLTVDADSTYQALEADVDYDPAQLVARGVRRVGDARAALVQTNTRDPGRVRIALASRTPLQRGTVLMLQFEARQGHVHPAIRILHALVEAR